MSIATLIQKLRTKKQETNRTAFSHYLGLVKSLASGAEIDSDEAAAILAATGRSESDLESDVNRQQQRFEWARQREAHYQSIEDRAAAERELSSVQAELNATILKLQPRIDAARDKMQAAEYRRNVTYQAEGLLMDAANVLDAELLQRERSLTQRLRELAAEINPLRIDLSHKRDSLRSAEDELERIRRRDPGNVFTGVGAWFGQVLPDQKPAQRRIDDLRNQIAQLERHIQPRQQELDRLTAELHSIHEEKLRP